MAELRGQLRPYRDSFLRVHLRGARQAAADYREARQQRLWREWADWSDDPWAWRYAVAGGGDALGFDAAVTHLASCGLGGRELEQQLFGNRVRT
jgi:hypothetical protein